MAELHKVAVGLPVGTPYDELARAGGFAYEQGRVTQIDQQHHRLEVENRDGKRTVPYGDALVLSPGGIAAASQPGLFPLRTASEAQKLHRELEKGIADSGGRPMKVVIVGQGLTGIQVAGHIAQAYGDKVKVSLVGRGLALPTKNEDLIAQTRRELQARGVELKEQRDATAMAPDHVIVKAPHGAEERLDARIVIPTLGSVGAASRMSDNFGTTKRGNLLEVDPFQRVRDKGGDVMPDVWAAGDASSAGPPTAYMAKAEGQLVAQNLQRSWEGKEPQPLVPYNPGFFVSIGDSAVGEVHPPAQLGRLLGLIRAQTAPRTAGEEPDSSIPFTGKVAAIAKEFVGHRNAHPVPTPKSWLEYLSDPTGARALRRVQEQRGPSSNAKVDTGVARVGSPRVDTAGS